MNLYALFCSLLMMTAIPAFAGNETNVQKEQDSFSVLQ